MSALPAFNETELKAAKELLSAKVATMLGRKMEEGDWDFVYCHAKQIPLRDWSNLHIDINHKGLGVEHKMLRITRNGPIRGECGTTKMHPAGTRSIRIPEERDANKAAESILTQYNALIDQRTAAVSKAAGGAQPDMRTGWLLWKDTLDEFLYFEERMSKPDPQQFYAEWNITPARGARKASKSLWIYERNTGKKRYSVTTEAGAKIQPYFDVPPPGSPHLYHFKVQGVTLDGGLVEVWLTRATAKYLELLYGSLDPQALSSAILSFEPSEGPLERAGFVAPSDIAVPVRITESAYKKLKSIFEPISDEYLLQQFALSSAPSIKVMV